MDEIGLSQRAIVKWCMEPERSKEEIRSLLGCFPKHYLGKYEKISEWMDDKGPELSTDFSRYLATNKSTEAYMEVFHSLETCQDPYKEAKILCRYALGKEFTKFDVVSALKEYEARIEAIEEARQGYVSRKYSGNSVVMEVYEDVCERIESGDQEALAGYSWGFQELDALTDGLRKGTVTRLSAYANTGKSKFSYHLTNNLLKQGAKVMYASLEVGRKEVVSNLLANFYEIGYYDFTKGRVMPDISTYPSASLTVHDGLRSMDDIETAVSKLKPDVLVLDYVQKIRTNAKNEYERMTDVANRMQDLAVLNNVTVFDLSQVPNDGKDFVSGSVIPSKGSGDLVAAADVAIVLTRSKKDKFLELHLAKNKFGRNWVSFYLIPDYSKSSFKINGEVNASSF